METEAFAIADVLPFTGQPDSSLDMDARAERYKRAAILKSRRAYYLSRRPADFAYFNINHPNMQHNRPQIDRVMGWKFGPKGLIAAGAKSGLGKSRSMFALCKRLLCVEGRDVAIWNAQEFFAELQANVRFGRDEAGDFIKRQAAREVFFMDDYGQQAVKDNREEWAQGWFFRLLDLRIGNRLPVLMTTNLTAQQMADDERALSASPLMRRLTELADGVRFT